MPPEDNPADDVPADKDEYDRWQKEQHIPDGYYFVDDADGGRLVKKTRSELADEQAYKDLADSGGIVDAP